MSSKRQVKTCFWPRVTGSVGNLHEPRIKPQIPSLADMALNFPIKRLTFVYSVWAPGLLYDKKQFSFSLIKTILPARMPSNLSLVVLPVTAH